MKKFFLISMGILLILSVWMSLALAMDVTLQWDPNVETDLAGYKLYYRTTAFVSTDPVPAAGATGWTVITVPVSATPTRAVTGLPNVKHWFAVTAHDSETPSLQSGFSNVVTAGPVSTPVAPPKNLRVTLTQ
jgi:hypothetical protein